MKKIDIQKLVKDALICRFEELLNSSERLKDRNLNFKIRSNGPYEALKLFSNDIYEFYKEYPTSVINRIPYSITIRFSKKDNNLLRVFIKNGCRDSGYKAIQDYIEGSIFVYKKETEESLVPPTIF